jgi:hypothetical protein
MIMFLMEELVNFLFKQTNRNIQILFGIFIQKTK